MLLFINLTLVREKTSALTVPAVETVSEWDGKDAKLESNEISLDELFSDNEL